MRTVRCSGPLLRCLPGGCLPGGCLPRWGCLPRGVSAYQGICPGGDRILDTRLLKHYLSATTVAGGSKQTAIEKKLIFFSRLEAVLSSFRQRTEPYVAALQKNKFFFRRVTFTKRHRLQVRGPADGYVQAQFPVIVSHGASGGKGDKGVPGFPDSLTTARGSSWGIQ